MDMAAAKEMFRTFKVTEFCESFEEQVKLLEHQLELKEYYDIKRPQAVIFSQMAQASNVKTDQKKQQVITVSHFDLLCEKGNGNGFNEFSVCSDVKVLKSNKNHQLVLSQCHALPHPSNNQLYLV